MIELEDDDVALAAVDTRMVGQIFDESLLIRSKLQLAFLDDAKVLLTVLGVVPTRALAAAIATDGLVAVTRKLPPVELSDCFPFPAQHTSLLARRQVVERKAWLHTRPPALITGWQVGACDTRRAAVCRIPGGCDILRRCPRPWGDCGPIRSLSMRGVRLLALTAVLAASLVACGGGGSKGSASDASGNRPTSSARLQIVQPTTNQVTGPDVKVEFNLIGATVVPATNVGPPKSGNEGHIHVSVDGKLVSMAYGTSQDVPGLAPGRHNLRAEFVATDHKPFKNPIVTAVFFTVQG
jgi:hypothetical protein